ncbi:hypothetical protein QT196_06705 [Streptomyces sp. P9-2B-2]|uniref:transposase n=1 Tax=Streptomyces TaxID=1883 RepID=UPI002001DB1A|nr:MULTISPECIES: transposase [Streptomyces]MCX4638412.1 transposase [Streptomyces platensis]WJY36995.1 hypothetical protein QT196_06705 [Streptomyces sp. P9-2B-2]
MGTGKKPGRPPKSTRRQLIEGIRFRTRTGVPWRKCARAVRSVGAGVRPVPPLAAGR